jgi:hypothetical protein
MGILKWCRCTRMTKTSQGTDPLTATNIGPSGTITISNSIGQLGFGSISLPKNNYTNTDNFGNGIYFSSTQRYNNKITASIIEIKSDNNNPGESATIDTALVNDLRLLLECINQIPDNHPLFALKQDFYTRKALKALGS